MCPKTLVSKRFEPIFIALEELMEKLIVGAVNALSSTEWEN